MVDVNRSLGKITVNGGGEETPQRQILQRLFPAIPQVRGDDDFLRGLVQNGLVAVTALDCRISRKIDAGVDQLGKIVQ